MCGAVLQVRYGALGGQRGQRHVEPCGDLHEAPLLVVPRGADRPDAVPLQPRDDPRRLLPRIGGLRPEPVARLVPAAALAATPGHWRACGASGRRSSSHAQPVLVAQRAVALADGRALGAQPEHMEPVLVDGRDGEARKAQLPVAGPEFVERGGGIEVIGYVEAADGVGVRAAEPKPDRGGRYDGVALEAQPAGQLGETGPGPPQGEQFGCVAVELRPALSHIPASRARYVRGDPAVR